MYVYLFIQDLMLPLEPEVVRFLCCVLLVLSLMYLQQGCVKQLFFSAELPLFTAEFLYRDLKVLVIFDKQNHTKRTKTKKIIDGALATFADCRYRRASCTCVCTGLQR